MNTLFAPKYTCFVLKLHLLKWRAQRPSNMNDVNSRETGKIKSLLEESGATTDFIFVLLHVIFVRLCFM